MSVVVALANVPVRCHRHNQVMLDPLAGTPWSQETTVQGFLRSPPNDTLLRFAASEHRRAPQAPPSTLAAAPDATPCPWPSTAGGTGDGLSWPMLDAAAVRARSEATRGHLHLAMAPMDALPARSHGST